MKIKHLLMATRLPYITASILPVILIAVWLGTLRHQTNVLYLIIAILGVAAAHLASNTINDYFDWDRSDKINRFPSPFNGGTRYLLGDILKRKTYLHLGIGLICFCLLLFAFLIFHGRAQIWWIVGLAAMAVIFYSAPPFSFQNRGLGEIVILISFGPLITLATGYLITNEFAWSYFLIGLPPGFLTTNIIWINEFPDYTADKLVGKKNLVVRLGLEKSRYIYLLLHLGYYLSILIFVGYKILPNITLLALLLIPFSIKSIRHTWKHYANPNLIHIAQLQTIQMQAIGTMLLALLTAGAYFGK